jgi:hypothetical protein
LCLSKEENRFGVLKAYAYFLGWTGGYNMVEVRRGFAHWFSAHHAPSFYLVFPRTKINQCCSSYLQTSCLLSLLPPCLLYELSTPLLVQLSSNAVAVEAVGWLQRNDQEWTIRLSHHSKYQHRTIGPHCLTIGDSLHCISVTGPLYEVRWGLLSVQPSATFCFWFNG